MEEMATETTPEEQVGQVVPEGTNGVGTPEASHFDRMQFDPTSLPDSLRNEPSLQTFTTVDNLAKSYVNAVKKIGGNPDHLVQIPQEGESRDNFYNAIGRPQTPEGYEFGDDGGQLEFYRDASHKLGLSNSQAQGMLKLYAAVEGEQNKQSQKANADFHVNSQIELKREWNVDYDKKLEYAQRVFGQYASPEFKQLMDKTGLGNHPELLKTFSKIGQMLGEDQLVVGSGIGGQAMSTVEAREEIQRLYADKAFSQSYLNKTDPGHRQATNTMEKLFSHAYAGQRG